MCLLGRSTKKRFSLDTNLGGGTLKSMNRKAHGFTIVELLIVIVVIAILAAISIAAYTSIQQRAKNTAIINAASQSLKMIEAYIAANGTYPLKSNSCITSESTCVNNLGNTMGSNAAFGTNMATIGTLPKNVPNSGDKRYGILYWYHSAATVDTISQPLRLQYWLLGINQNCGVTGVLTYTDQATLSTTSYTRGDDDGKTLCLVTVPGPVHS